MITTRVMEPPAMPMPTPNSRISKPTPTTCAFPVLTLRMRIALQAPS